MGRGLGWSGFFGNFVNGPRRVGRNGEGKRVEKGGTVASGRGFGLFGRCKTLGQAPRFRLDRVVIGVAVLVRKRGASPGFARWWVHQGNGLGVGRNYLRSCYFSRT